MPKLKTNRGAAKRFRRNGRGQLKRAHGYHNHILTKKAQKRKRRLRGTAAVAPSDNAAINKLLRG